MKIQFQQLVFITKEGERKCAQGRINSISPIGYFCLLNKILVITVILGCWERQSVFPLASLTRSFATSTIVQPEGSLSNEICICEVCMVIPFEANQEKARAQRGKQRKEEANVRKVTSRCTYSEISCSLLQKCARDRQ